MQKINFYRLLMPSVLDGTKTMTRRVIPQSVLDEYDDYLTTCRLAGAVPTKVIEKSRYKVGEVVAIAQPYKDCGYHRFQPSIINGGRGDCANNPGWTNKMFVRADLMPHQIRITSIKVERLQDISDEDCIKEGVVYHKDDTPFNYYFRGKDGDWNGFVTPKEAFQFILHLCCKPKTLWNDNPWVFAYSYKLVK